MLCGVRTPPRPPPPPGTAPASARPCLPRAAAARPRSAHSRFPGGAPSAAAKCHTPGSNPPAPASPPDQRPAAAAPDLAGCCRAADRAPARSPKCLSVCPSPVRPFVRSVPYCTPGAAQNGANPREAPQFIVSGNAGKYKILCPSASRPASVPPCREFFHRQGGNCGKIRPFCWKTACFFTVMLHPAPSPCNQTAASLY